MNNERCLETFKKQESREVKEYGNCCCQLQKKISTTGFAEIAKSKRFLRKAINLFVFGICTVGYLYHTWTFLQLYLTYPTTLDISEEYPDSVSAPAITICNRNRLFRQRYCEALPELCIWPHTTWEEFCAAHRRQCPDMKPLGFNFGIPNLDITPNWNWSNIILNAVGPYKGSEVIGNCWFKGATLSSVCNSSIMIQAANGGYPYKCFTLFSLLGNQYEKPLNVNINSVYTIELHMHPEQYMNDNDLVQASVAVHDPRKLVNPMTEGVTLTGGVVYELYPTLEKRESLPLPYASNCTDYLNEWKKNGGYGPLSKKDCIELCKIKAVSDEYGCVARSMTYPNNYTICEYIYYDALPEVNRMCSSSCGDACEEKSYAITTETLQDLHRMCNSMDEHCKYEVLKFSVMFSRMTIQKFQQMPKFESIELFSYIGGYLGMWLGISLASVYDIGEWIYDSIAYLRLRWRRIQKTTMPDEQFRNHAVLKKRRNIVKSEHCTV